MGESAEEKATKEATPVEEKTPHDRTVGSVAASC
jgi:hypothetical protein